MAPVVDAVMARMPEHPTVDPGYVFTAPAQAWGSDQASTEVLEALRGLEG